MVSAQKKVRMVTVVAHDEEAIDITWMDLVLVVSILVLGLVIFFQLFPGVWASVVSLLAVVFSYIDVRGWTWRSYAVVCAVAISVLVILKGRQDSD